MKVRLNLTWINDRLVCELQFCSSLAPCLDGCIRAECSSCCPYMHLGGERVSTIFMFLSFSHTAPTGQAQLCCNWLSPTEFSGGFRLQLLWEAYYTLLHTYTLQTEGGGGGGGMSEFIWRIHSLSVDSDPAGCSDKNQKLTKKAFVCVSKCVSLIWALCMRVCESVFVWVFEWVFTCMCESMSVGCV